MNKQEKNKMNMKGYTPVQLAVAKALAEEKYVDLAKILIYDEEISLECRGPEGWTPLQESLIKVLFIILREILHYLRIFFEAPITKNSKNLGKDLLN
jgi:hypothetical protein